LDPQASPATTEHVGGSFNLKGKEGLEMKLKYRGGDWEVNLVDDGTLDTVIKISEGGLSKEIRFDAEASEPFRDPATGALSSVGFEELSQDAIDEMLDESGEFFAEEVDSLLNRKREDLAGGIYSWVFYDPQDNPDKDIYFGYMNGNLGWSFHNSEIGDGGELSILANAEQQAQFIIDTLEDQGFLYLCKFCGDAVNDEAGKDCSHCARAIAEREAK
jgi:hypothetical protein